MKFLAAQFAYFLRDVQARRNVRTLVRLLLLLLVLVAVYTVVFHLLMAAEGQDHSWLTGLYWTFTVMTTLGFGDITFDSDPGRFFSIVVLLSGVVFLLVLLPFTFIQFFYAPWMEAQRQLRAPRELPEGTAGHVVITHFDAVTTSLIPRLEFFKRDYVVLEEDVPRALELHDRGIKVMVGPRDDLQTYRRARADAAALVVANGNDFLNSNIAFTVLVLAGTKAQLHAFDSLVVIYNVFDRPVVIIGGGRVGRSVAAYLREREVPYRVVEVNPERAAKIDHVVIGSADDIDVLKKAGIEEAPAALITTNDDATNIYLTIYCRRLRPDMQIISRATLERNVSTLHRAGADFVMSYASMGANTILNVLEQGDVVMLAEGLDVFRYPASAKVIGLPLRETRIREETGCSVIALQTPEGGVIPNPDPSRTITAGTELILIGTADGERLFKENFT